MHRLSKLSLVLVLVCTLFSGCSVKYNKIAYTVYPLGWLVTRLSGNQIEVESIQNDNSVIQLATIRDDYQSILDESDGFFYIGGLEPYLDVYDSILKNVNKLNLASNNAVYSFGRLSNNVKVNYYDGDAFKLVDTYKSELSLWNDPILMVSMAREIRDWLIDYYPLEINKFNENYEALVNELIELDSKYQSFANSVNDFKFVSVTNNFGIWQDDYGFGVYPLMLSKYGTLPNEQQLQIIENKIMEDGVQYIFYETNMSDEMIALFNRVQSDCDLIRVDISNLSSLTSTQSSDGKDYLSIMYENLQTLKDLYDED